MITTDNLLNRSIITPVQYLVIIDNTTRVQELVLDVFARVAPRQKLLVQLVQTYLSSVQIRPKS